MNSGVTPQGPGHESGDPSLPPLPPLPSLHLLLSSHPTPLHSSPPFCSQFPLLQGPSITATFPARP